MKNLRAAVRTCSFGCQSGFSLIELMVAITLGLVLVAGLGLLFANSSQSSNELDKSIRQMENGRYAVELLSRDISVAGYYGEVSLKGLTFASPDSCTTALASLGWSNSGSSAPIPLTGLSNTQATVLTCLPNLKSDSIALVIRRLDTIAIDASSIVSGTPYVQTSSCSDSTVDASNIKFIASSTASDFTLHDLSCASINKVRKFITRIYYVASCDECGVDTIPTLKRAELVGSQFVVSPLSEGVERIAFDYGFDTNGDGVPDTFRVGLSGVSGSPDNDWSNVVGVRLYVLSRTTESTGGYTDSKSYLLGLAGKVGPFNDDIKRRAYSTTVRINNMAGVREP